MYFFNLLKEVQEEIKKYTKVKDVISQMNQKSNMLQKKNRDRKNGG